MPLVWGWAAQLSGGQSAGPEPPALFVVQGIYVLLAALGALRWAPLDRRGTLTERLFWPTHTALRLLLALYLFMYGWQKVFLLQMPAPDTVDLLTPFGQMSLMGGELVLTSTPGPAAYTVVLQPTNADETFLMDRHFHWTTEGGENR